MNNKKNNFLLPGILFLIAFVAAYIISYVSLKIEIENLKKENVELEESLYAKKNLQTMLKVEIQKLEQESRVIGVASTKLDMIKSSNDEAIILNVDKMQIEQLNQILNNKYD